MAILQSVLMPLVAAFLLLLLFLHAVREGRFSSPGARAGAVTAIAMTAILLWLGPGLFLGR